MITNLIHRYSVKHGLFALFLVLTVVIGHDLILPPFLYIRFIYFLKSKTSASLTEFLEKYVNIHNTKFIPFDPS